MNGLVFLPYQLFLPSFQNSCWPGRAPKAKGQGLLQHNPTTKCLLRSEVPLLQWSLLLGQCVQDWNSIPGTQHEKRMVCGWKGLTISVSSPWLSKAWWFPSCFPPMEGCLSSPAKDSATVLCRVAGIERLICPEKQLVHTLLAT